MSFRLILLCFGFLIMLSACSSERPLEADLIEKNLNEIMAAKTSYAITKYETPLLNTYVWESIFGGPSGDALSYDRFGEIDQLVLLVPPGTPLSLQRQVRTKTRNNQEILYYKVSSPLYPGPEALWTDGRFLDLQDFEAPQKAVPSLTATEIASTLQTFKGLPYTWHGSSAFGAEKLLEWYPPSKTISERTKNDWILKGFDSLGMLFRASQGKTPLDLSQLIHFGDPVALDLSSITNTDARGNTLDNSLAKAKALMAILEPLDIIVLKDRIWIVVSREELIESRYRSQFDGQVTISSLLDTLYGLFQKAIFVNSPQEEATDPNQKYFFIRRFSTMLPAPKEESSDEESTEFGDSSLLQDTEIIE